MDKRKYHAHSSNYKSCTWCISNEDMYEVYKKEQDNRWHLYGDLLLLEGYMGWTATFDGEFFSDEPLFEDYCVKLQRDISELIMQM